MSEERIPISKIDSKIVESVHSGKRCCVLTYEGVPKAVLLGYDEYSALREAADLWSRPQVIQDILEGQRQVRRGETIPLEDVVRKLTQDGVVLETERGRPLTYPQANSERVVLGSEAATQSTVEPGGDLRPASEVRSAGDRDCATRHPKNAVKSAWR